MAHFPELEGYKWKEVIPGYIFYFDRRLPNCVIAIEGIEKHSLTYILEDKRENKMILSTQMEDNKTITTDVDLNQIFIIPEIDRRQDTVYVKQKRQCYPGNLNPPCIFQIINYGALTDPNMKGCNFSESSVIVLAENSRAQVYKIGFIVGKGVICGDGNPRGTIKGAYQFKTPLIIRNGRNIQINK